MIVMLLSVKNELFETHKSLKVRKEKILRIKTLLRVKMKINKVIKEQGLRNERRRWMEGSIG